jgi:hypothetical protein
MKQTAVSLCLVLMVLAGSLTSCFLFGPKPLVAPSNVRYEGGTLYWTDNSNDETFFQIWSVQCVTEWCIAGLFGHPCPPCKNKERVIAKVEANVTRWSGGNCPLGVQACRDNPSGGGYYTSAVVWACR